MLSSEKLLATPKVLLHDHLDGGLRTESMIEMAEAVGYDSLPAHDPIELASWFVQSCDSGSLVRYLETFEHTVALMQTQEQIIRVARECVIDLAATGVVYAEVRGAPELFTRKGLSLNQIVDATIEGYAQGMAEVKRTGSSIRVEGLLCGMRQNSKTEEVARLVVEYRGRGIVGFDIAGPEIGFPPTTHLRAFNYLRENNSRYTIHAGEAAGLESISQALHECQAWRIGHGVRLIDDINFNGEAPVLGQLAQEILDQQIPLELAPTSNLQTGAAVSYEAHPIGILKKLGFKVTLNTDNRLMSQTSMVREATEIARAFDWGLSDLQDVAVNSMTAAFIPEEERSEILTGIILPKFKELRDAS